MTKFVVSMHDKKLKIFIFRFLVLTILFSFIQLEISAAKLYWVGGSGSFKDSAHWSFTSGGAGGAKTPTKSDDLIYDSKSFKSPSVVNIIGNPSCHSILIQNVRDQVIFTGTENESLFLYEDFKIKANVQWEFPGSIIFTGTESAKFNPGINPIGSHIQIEKFNASLTLEKTLTLKNRASFFANSGELISSYQAIYCNDFVKIGTGIFTLSTSNFLISANGRMELNSSFRDNSTFTELQYSMNHPENDQVNETDFSSFRIVDQVTSMRMPATATVVDSATCNGDCDGSVLVTFSGPGTAPYTITFTAGTVTTFSGVLSSPFLATNLCAGNYTVRVFNSANQQIGSAANVFVYEPSVIAINFNQSTNPLCFGDCTGQILFDIIGGNPTYSAIWQPANVSFNSLSSSQEDSIENLCNGYQVVNIADRKGCTGMDSFLIVQPSRISPNGGVTNQLCFGYCDGKVFVAPSGGTPFSLAQSNGIFYQTVWDGNPLLNNDTLYNLCPGTHTVSITDANGCDTTITLVINPNTQLSFNSTFNANLACFDVCNGSAQVSNVSGGTPPYNFTWSGPSNPTLNNTANSSSASSLCAGTYSVLISDANGCDTLLTFNFVAPPLLVASVITDDVDCNAGTNGSASASAVGGTVPVTFSWFNSLNPPPASAFANGISVTGLTAGSYTLIAVDANGCNDTSTFILNEPAPLVVTITSNNPACFGQSNGSATATVNGGTPIPPANTYNFSWNSTPVQNTQTANNLPAGSYTVTVTDNNGCIETESINLNTPTQIQNNLITTSPNCFGDCNGTAVSNPSGGSGSGYTFNWSCSGSTLNSVSGLCAGPCTLTVTDGTGCSRTSNFTLTQPNAITVALTSTPLNCSGASTAQISSLVNGGTPPYSYCWNPPTCTATSPGLSNVGAGTYVLQVTDSKLCTQNAQVIINSPPPISISLTATNPTCFGATNGSISNVVNGGTPNYSFLWLPINVTSQNPPANSLSQGNYTVNVTDALGCTATQTIQLSQPDQIVASTDSIQPTCVGQCDGSLIATAQGGNAGGFSFSWSSVPVQNNNPAINLCVGTYTVTVTDPLGCTGTGIGQVTQPTALTASASNITPSCNICNGTATISGNGGVPPYSFAVDGSPSLTNLTNLCAGTHTLVVTDANNCSATITFLVPQQVSILIDATASTLTCNGDCNGVATAVATGGNGQVSFLWTSPSPTNPTTQNTQTATALCAGTHTITVTDQLGCSSTETVTFLNPPLLTVSSTSTPIACSGASIGTASVTANGGVPPINVIWSNGINGNSISNLGPGIYTATITDANGCTESETVTISTAPTLTVSVNTVSPSGCGLSDGSITVVPVGGSGNFNYSWSSPPGGSTPTITNLASGVYAVTISDAITGCDTIFPVGLSDPNGPVTSQVSTNATCNQTCNGSGTVDVISGVAPFTVSWPNAGSNGSPPQTQSALCAGIYPVEVTDGNGCVTIETVSISQPDQFQENAVVTSPLCNSETNGSIIYTPIGGTAPYNFVINTLPDDSAMTGLSAGVFTVTVTDALNCQYNSTYTLSDPATITLTETHSNIGCNGPSSGNASSVAIGGTPPYSTQWISNTGVIGVASTISNLSVGSYTLQITDANGCVQDTAFSITQNPLLVANFSSTNNLCNSGCTGSAGFQPTGGSGTYSFSWNTNPTQSTSTITALCPGFYNATLNDDAGCTITQSFTILPAPTIAIVISSTDPLCNNDCNGTATASANGGTGNLSYSWSPNLSNSPTATNLCSGAYIVTVTDQNNCSSSQFVTLSNPTLVSANITSLAPDCFGACDAQAISNPIGGTLPYSFDWIPGLGTNDTLNNLCSGNYTVSVSDGNGCRDTSSVVITDPPQVSVVASTSAATCGQCDGIITINNIVGTTITWLAPLSGNAFLQPNLCAGIYQAIVSDANNCSDTVEFTISNSNGPVVNVDTTNASCFGNCDGTASVVSVSGNAPFIYSWALPIVDSDSTTANLCAGNYISQVTDANGCITFTNFTVNEPDEISVSEIITDASCLGLNDGIISLNPSGGTPSYSFSWSNSAPDSLAAINLAPGSYSVTVTDANSCSALFSFTVGSTQSINFDLSVSGTNCFGNCNGSATLNNITGGIAPYSIVWNDPFGQTNSSANNLCAGPIQAIISDVQGCVAIADTNVVQPDQFNFNPSVLNSICGECSGSINLNPNGGTAPFTFQWSNGSTDSVANNLCAGVYLVNVLDANNCFYQENIAISDSNGPQLAISVINESCFLSCDGSANVTVTNGNGPFLYNWLPSGQNSSSQQNLCNGTYFVQVRDVNNCLTTDTVVISGPEQILPNQNVQPSTCGSCDGEISLNPTGGSGSGYSYVWSSGLPSNASQTNLCAGSYTVEITDGLGCTDTMIVALNSTNSPVLSIDIDSVSCFGLSDASATLAISGGSSPYTVNWSNGSASNPTVNGLTAGNYLVTVTDAQNCVSNLNFDVFEPTALAFSLANSSLPDCQGICNGSLAVIPVGGTLNYSYLWSNNLGSSDSVSGLCAGSYSVTVTDFNGCSASQTSFIANNPNPFLANSQIIEPTCNECNGSIILNISGGLLPYNLNWTNGDTTQAINSICAGVYQVQITDANGCEQINSFPISNTNGITGDSIQIQNESCLASCDGSATVSAIGGVLPISYVWLNNGSTSQTQNTLCSGTYFVLMTDSNLCIRTAQIDILSPSQMQIVPNVQNPTCNNSDGSISFPGVSGGTPPYNFIWSPPVSGNSSSATGLSAGNYSVTISDSSPLNCSQTFTISLSSQNGPIINDSISQISCSGVCDGEISLDISAIQPVTIQWSNGSNLNQLTSLCEGNYSVVVTDANGCSTSEIYSISEPDSLLLSSSFVENTTCYAFCNGSIHVSPFGGTLPYSFSWSGNPINSASLDSVCAGTETLNMIDANGCILNQAFNLSSPDSIIISSLITNTPCSSLSNGQIDISVSGGTPTYHFQWSGSSTDTTEDISGLPIGDYTLFVTDANNCLDSVSLSVLSTDTVIASAGLDSVFCDLDSLLLDGSSSFTNSGLLSYSWISISSGDTIGTDSIEIVNPDPGTLNFILTVSNQNGCVDSDSVQYVIHPLPLADAGLDTSIIPGQSVVIGGNPTGPINSIFYWTPSIGLNDSLVANPVTSATVATQYVVTVTDENGCISRDTMDLRIKPEIFIPNGISPNSDGKNDFWVINNLDRFPDNEVEIYNRWGELLYYKKNYDNKWDGTYNGKPLPIGTYYYVIKLNDPKFEEAYTGPLTLFK